MNISNGTRKWLTIFALVFYAHASSVCCSIRYGFLADAFARKKVPGKIYGLIGTSLIAGYVFMFATQILESWMRKCNSMVILASNMLGFAIVALLTGFAYCIPNTTAVIAISFVMRMLQGLLAYTSTLAPVDFINANFPNEFDMVNGLLNMGYFSGHGIAEAVGCVIYDHFGYEVAFVFSAVVAVISGIGVVCFIPKSRTYVSSQIPDIVQTEAGTEPHDTKLTKLLIFPLIATMLVNANYGVLQVSLHDPMSLKSL